MSANRKHTKSDFAKVDAYQNEAADYEELPEVTDVQLARAKLHKNGVPARGRPLVGEHPKQQVTLRLDRDILDYYRGQGPGWQTTLNAVLRKSIST